MVVTSLVAAGALTARPVSAGLLGNGLLGNVLCPVTNTLSAVTSAGWDDGATTPPTTLTQVEQAIGATQLYSRGITGAGIGVAVIDSGVVPVQGLGAAGKVVNGPDLSLESQSGGQYFDAFGHGTHIAGIIAGNDGSASGFQGIAPGAHLVSIKIAAHDGSVDVSQMLAAIDWVVQHRNDQGMNIRVLNLAYGTQSVQSYQLDPIAFAVENAWRHGIVTVVAGGNTGTSTGSLTDPAVDPYVLAVGAANLNGSTLLGCASVAPFSNRSSTRPVDVLAPGVSIESLRDPGSVIDQAHPGSVVDTRFFRGSGTSQATGVVSGAAALVLQANPNLTPDQVKALFKSTASPLGLLDASAEGSGMINVDSASRSWVPWGSTQRWNAATGGGSLEQARGGSHISINGVVVGGEQDIMAMPWSGAQWAPSSAAASAWNGGVWNGSTWAGSCWCGTSWTGATTWSGGQWSGGQWSGGQWSGGQWSGGQWSGGQWSGGQWSGGQWSGGQWSGGQWSGGQWSGGQWSGGQWSGGQWSGGQWSGGQWQ
jgi:serine protease AprX